MLTVGGCCGVAITEVGGILLFHMAKEALEGGF